MNDRYYEPDDPEPELCVRCHLRDEDHDGYPDALVCPGGDDFMPDDEPDYDRIRDIREGR